jgi:hypothetical protein
MKVSVIRLTFDNGQIAADIKGDANAQEINWALDQLKVKLLSGNFAGKNFAVPGMLTPDLKRLPGDVARRLVS